MEPQRAVALVPEKNKIYAYDSLISTWINRNLYMGTPLEEMEPPCEQKALM